MTKLLFLLRHAKSDWNNDLGDHERPLNERGLRDVPLMAARIANQIQTPETIIASSAVRTQTTARLMATAFGIQQSAIQTFSDLYLAPPNTMLNKLQHTPLSIDSLMMVAHNPGTTELANFFHPRLIDNIPTCGVVCLQFDVDDWKNISPANGQVMFVDYPKK